MSLVYIDILPDSRIHLDTKVLLNQYSNSPMMVQMPMGTSIFLTYEKIDDVKKKKK